MTRLVVEVQECNGKVEFKEVVKFKNNEKEGESINLEKYL